jgi:hypothetical protein
VEEGANAGETNYLYMSKPSDTYLTPEQTLPPPAALLVATIRGSAFNELEEAEDQQLLKVGESLAPYSRDLRFIVEPRYKHLVDKHT